MENTYIFESERLGFRRWNIEDREPFAKMNNDQEVMEFLPKKLTSKESCEFISRIEEHFEIHNYGLWVAEVKETSKFVGFIGFYTATFESDFTPCIEIGWRINRENWSLGYATEGAKACLEYGFNHLGFEKVYSFTSKLNIRSINVMKKIGLVEEREFNHPRLEEKDPLRPHVLYSIYKS